tara:strand:+ start:120 stop:1526 length:1407 start_codon:yes stop_codon:yes gene_type:complete
MTVIIDNFKTFEYVVPVLVIGGGAAGLTAALAAKDQSSDVLVLERDALLRGSTAMSQGNIAAAGTNSQKELGIEDSGKTFAEDIIKITKGKTDHNLAHIFANASGPTVDWLVNCHKIPLKLDLDWGAKLGHSKPRIHSTPSKTGLELINCLENACKNSGVDILTNARVTSLYKNDQNIVTGVMYKRPDGSFEEVGCKSLIITTCGFGANKDMIRKYIPEMSDATYHGHEGNDGSGINWGIELGAKVSDMSAFQGLGALIEPSRILLHYNTILNGGIIVNINGKRFTNETIDISGMGRKVSSQPENYVWFIFDKIRNKFAMRYEEHQEAIKFGAIQEAKSFKDLSSITKIPISTLSNTINDAILMQNCQHKDKFGRDFSSDIPLQGPPWYAVKCIGALFHTQGGLVINENAQVMNVDEELLPNVFAAGGTARSISGPSDWGYIPAAGLFTAVTQGRLAGTSASKTTNKI